MQLRDLTIPELQDFITKAQEALPKKIGEVFGTVNTVTLNQETVTRFMDILSDLSTKIPGEIQRRNVRKVDGDKKTQRDILNKAKKIWDIDFPENDIERGVVKNIYIRAFLILQGQFNRLNSNHGENSNK